MSISYNGLHKTIEKNKDKKALNSSITVRVNNDTKKEFEEVCDKMGMTVSQVINAFVNKAINVKSLPFNISEKFKVKK